MLPYCHSYRVRQPLRFQYPLTARMREVGAVPRRPYLTHSSECDG